MKAAQLVICVFMLCSPVWSLDENAILQRLADLENQLAEAKERGSYLKMLCLYMLTSVVYISYF